MRISARILLTFAAVFGALATAKADPGNVVSWSTTGSNELTFTCQNNSVRIQILDVNVARVTLAALNAGFSLPASYTVIKIWPLPAYTVADSGTATVITTSAMQVVVSKSPFRLSYYQLNGTLMLSDSGSPGLDVYADGSASAFFNQTSTEDYYGGGLFLGKPLSWKGQTVTLWNSYASPYFDDSSVDGASPHIPSPLVVSSKGYGVYFDNTWSQYWDFTPNNMTQWVVYTHGGLIDYYFIGATTPAAVLDSFTQMTGRPIMPPKWSEGYIQSRSSYNNWSVVETADTAFRTADLPCDCLVLDLTWFGGGQNMGALTFDTTNFPNPAGTISALGSDGFKVMAIDEPYFANTSTSNPVYTNYNEGCADDYMMTYDAGHQYCDQQDTFVGNAGYLDFNNPAAGSWFYGKLLPAMNDGLVGYWTDLGEPEYDATNDYSYDGKRESELHNVYNLLWHKALYTGHMANFANQRPFMLSRAGYTGDQRYGAGHWTSDTTSDWYTLAAHENALCEYSFLGFNLFSMDIGGFWGGPASDELYLRWFQFGSLVPVFRSHGVVSQPHAPYEFDSYVEDNCRVMMKLRYRLLPYLYTTTWGSYQTGMPICRAMPLQFPTDPNVQENGTQYMFGPSIMVAPITSQGATSRTVYFPAGRWIDQWSGQTVTGPASETWPGPEQQIIMFYADNSIIPEGPYVASTSYDDGSQRGLRINCSSSASYTLYDDDGSTNAYTAGTTSGTASATTAISANYSNKVMNVRIGGASGTYPGQPSRRSWSLEIHGTSAVRTVVADGAVLQSASNGLALASATSGWYLDGAQSLLRVKLPAASITQGHTVTAYYNPLPAPGPYEARIHCGGNEYSDSSGALWTLDQNYSTGSFGWESAVTSGSNYIANTISNTNDPLLYQNERNGSDFHYLFDVPDGTYDVDILNCETYWTQTGQRKFNIVINSGTVASNYDIVAAAGGPNIPATASYPVTVTNGKINIEFQGVATGYDTNARVSAIRVRKTADQDSDGDGIPNWWTQLYFGHPTGTAADQSLATSDPNGTGLTNLEDYLAGLNPQSTSSVFAIQIVQLNGTSGFTVSWPSVAGIVYRVQSSPTISSPTWTDAATNLVGTGGTITWTDSSSVNGRKFYQVVTP